MKTKRTKQLSNAKSGFTMIELMLSMSFLATLLIAVATIATNIIATYQKGLALKAVNSVGRNLIDEFTNAINSAPSVDIVSICNNLASENVQACIDDNAYEFIYQEQRSPQRNGNPDDILSELQYNGIFCTGHYSYIWNTPEGIGTGHTISLQYRAVNGGEYTLNAPRLARITDRTYRLCSATVDDSYNSDYDNMKVIDIRTMAHSTPTDASPLWNPIVGPEENFLRVFETDLMLYDFSVFPISQDQVTLRTYMSGTFILATTSGNIFVRRDGDFCSLRNTQTSSQRDIGSEFNYCSINKFNFAARTAGV